MIVIADKFGQLGNRLFVFAHFIGWGIENGVVIANPAFDEYAQHFEGTAYDPWCRYPARPNASVDVARWRRANYKLVNLAARLGNRVNLSSPWIGCLDIGAERYELGEDKHIGAMLSRMITLVRGWQYRDETSLHKHAHAIRTHFTPRSPHVRRIDEALAKARAACDHIIGVHIRRGDYRNFMGGRYYYETSVYLEMMSSLRRLFKNKEVGCNYSPLCGGLTRV
jgi:hypothetical protein